MQVLFLSLSSNPASYVIGMAGLGPHTRWARLPPANQGALMGALAPVFCLPMCETDSPCAAARLTLDQGSKWRTSHKWEGVWGGGFWAVDQKHHNTLCRSCYSTWRPVGMVIDPTATFQGKCQSLNYSPILWFCCSLLWQYFMATEILNCILLRHRNSFVLENRKNRNALFLLALSVLQYSGTAYTLMIRKKTIMSSWSHL